ncbi:glycosyltransferase family 39 protein [Sorangium sp. So ce1014]|uniref:ArnT family glycosyltransferase n=1 Tax=Sorangium sp. So ce1014 TaxID=3133326 RepID=UPI003F5EC734
MTQPSEVEGGADPAGEPSAPASLPGPAEVPLRARVLRWAGRHSLLLAVTALALAVRLVWNLWIHPPGEYVFSDMGGYVARANRLVEDPLARHADEAFFPYGAHYLLAAVKAVFGKDNETATAVFQAVTGAFTICFMTATSRRLSGRGWVPRVVGLIGVLYYPLISMGGYYLSEAPYAFFVAASAFYTIRLADEGRRGDAWLLGLSMGLGAAVRPQILMAVPFLAAFWLLRRRSLRRIRLPLLARAAIPIALVLAFSAARARYHTGRFSLVAQNGALNRVFGRCHNVKVEANHNWFGPPSIGDLQRHEQRHPDSLVKLDPAMGLELSIRGTMWDEDKLHKLAERCIQKTGWLQQARYAVTHVLMLWWYNVTWPDMGQPPFRPIMRAWNGVTMVTLPLPLVVAAALGFRRRFVRHGLLVMFIVSLFVVAMLYFGDTRFRVPYDSILIVLAVDVCGCLGRRLVHARPGRP